MIIPIVGVWIAVSPNTFRKMIVDTFHPGEARAAYDTEKLALRSFGFLRLLYAFPKDSAVLSPADPPHSGRVGVTTVTTWHLHTKSVYLRQKWSSSFQGLMLPLNTYLRNGCRRCHFCSTIARLLLGFFTVSVSYTRCGLA